MAKCDWYDGTLSVVLPEDPERIAVRLFDSRLAPARLYMPEVETLTLRDENAKMRELVAQRTAKRVIVSNADTDHATGHCECGACGGAIDPWDEWCRHCGARMEEDA
jgi:hypothetical protein